MKRYLIALLAAGAVAAFAAFIWPTFASERYPKMDKKDWCYRVVTDGNVYRLQFHWTENYWGDCIPSRVYTTLEEANKWLIRGQLSAEDFADEKKKEWKPVEDLTPAPHATSDWKVVFANWTNKPVAVAREVNGRLEELRVQHDRPAPY